MDNSETIQGKIVQVIGAVVDAEFPPGSTPEILINSAIGFGWSISSQEKYKKVITKINYLTR